MIPETREQALEVLGLSESADADEIKKAYHTLIKQWHPNKWVDKSEEEQRIATEKSQGITVAYGILTGKTEEELGEILKDLRKGVTSLFYGLHLNEEEIELFQALDNRDLEQTKILLEQVQDINARTMLCNQFPNKSILHYIVENSCNNPESGWIELLEEVLSKYNANNLTSVYGSSIGQHSGPNIIDLNVISMFHGPPLCFALTLGNLDVVNVLLKYGAEPDVRILHYFLMNSENNAAKAFLEHVAKIDADPEVEKLIIDGTTQYSRSTVEMLLPYMSNRQKSRMLQSIAYSDHEETDHDIELAKLLLKTGADPEFCGETEKGESDASALHSAKSKGKSGLVKLFNEHKGNAISNNSHSSGRRWIMIVPALLFGAIGATLATMGIIPEIVAIGVIATAMLSGIAGAVIGGVAGYLVDVAINQCRGNQQCAAQ